MGCVLKCLNFQIQKFLVEILCTVLCIKLGIQCSFECLSFQIQDLCNCGFGWQFVHCALHKLGIQWGVYFLMLEFSNPEGIVFEWLKFYALCCA